MVLFHDRVVKISATSVICSAFLLLSTVSSANAAVVPRTYSNPYFTIVSYEDPVKLAQLVPGEAATWDLQVKAHAAEPGTIFMGVSSQTPLENMLNVNVSITTCSVAWESGQCPVGVKTVVSDKSVKEILSRKNDQGITQFASMTSLEERWVDVKLMLPESPIQDAQKLDLEFHAWGHDTSLSTQASSLAATGLTALPPIPAMLYALGLGFGVVVMGRLIRSVRQTATEEQVGV